MAHAGYADGALVDKARSAVDWLLSDPRSGDRNQTGLHFGRAGAATAIADAIRADIYPLSRQTRHYLEAALSTAPDWPDITHGAAGQGVAALNCTDVLEDRAWAGYAEPYAEYLFASQDGSGAWAMPEGVASMTGERFNGFAHGAAGIIYFLCEYAHRANCKRAHDAWQRAVDWLIAQAIEDGRSGGLSWRWSDRNKTIWNWWCHGSLGIALHFLHLYDRTGDDRFIGPATHALKTLPARYRPVNLGQCHGLAGIGEVYLEAALILGRRPWRSRADELANTLIHLARPGKSGIWWAAGHSPQATADLMSGASGIMHFLLRWSEPKQNFTFQLLLGKSRRG